MNLPEWKLDQLSQIKSLSHSLIKIDQSMTKEKLREVCKSETGLSSFEHLHCLTDVMLQRFIDALKALLAFE